MVRGRRQSCLPGKPLPIEKEQPIKTNFGCNVGADPLVQRNKSMSEDLYKKLGVGKTASEEEIRSAYRKLAKELHPDLNPGDAKAEDRFKAVSSAFAILSDPEQRKRYDAGEIDDSGAETPEHKFYKHYADAHGPQQYHSTAGYEDFIDIGDIFAEAFGGRTRGQREGFRHNVQMRGGDIRYSLEIGFLEAANGERKRVTMAGGQTLDVTIPAGIGDGQVMRLQGKGQPGLNGGPPGDALIEISVRPHPLFRREGNDIHLDVPIGIHEAVLGAKIEVPTVSGRVQLTVPKGATTGKVVRLRGKGIKSKRGTGDQLVRFEVMLPDEVDDDLASFIKTWADDHKFDPRANWGAA